MKTTDIWFASFLMIKGYDISDFEVLPGRKGNYTFNISDADWKQMKLQFSSSEISKVKMCHSTLKDLLY